MKRKIFLLCLSAIVAATSVSNAQEWLEKASLRVSRGAMGGAAWKDRIYLFGGCTIVGGGITDTVEYYNTVTDTWSAASAMPTARVECVAATVGDKIYVIGGFDFASGALDLVEIYDPAADTWTTGTPMPTPRGQISACVIGGKIYVTGGYAGEYTSLEIYDPVTDSWATGADIPLGVLQNNGGVAIGSKFYVLGGKNYAGYAFYESNYIYNALSDSWTTGSDLPEQLFAGAATVFEGDIHYIGGSRTNVPTLNYDKHYVYNVASDSWSADLALPTERANHIAITVADAIYVMGGYESEAVSNLNHKYVKKRQQPSSLSNREKIEDLLQIYPNPAEHSLTLNWKGQSELSFTITDIAGRTVMSGKASTGQTQIELQAFPGGTYVVSFYEERVLIHTRKIVLTK